jgi:hypothetical protein
MSIYRGWRALPADIQKHDVHQQRTNETAKPPEQIPVHLRRAQPALALLPRTAAWIASLPPRVQPHALAASYARIANLVCSTWYDKPALDKYFEELLIGSRPGRKGFPPAVLRDLHTLRAYHEGMNQGSTGSSYPGPPYLP